MKLPFKTKYLRYMKLMKHGFMAKLHPYGLRKEKDVAQWHPLASWHPWVINNEK